MTREEARVKLIEIRAQLEVILSMYGLEISEVFDMAIKALSAEPCEDCISRKSILSRFEHINEVYTFISIGDLRKVIGDMPSIQPNPKTGHWKYVTDKTGHWVWECDKCGWQQRFNTKFCPDCGAKMESEDKE